MATPSIAVGDTAPDFTLTNQSGQQVTLSEYRDRQVVVLYFYPRDDTYGCTREACAFRDKFEDFVDAGAVVIGVSSDSVASHDQFATKHRLPFQLVADRGGQLRASYGVSAGLGVLPGRVTYVIDRQGVVRHIFSSRTQFEGHVERALKQVHQLTQAA